MPDQPAVDRTERPFAKFLDFVKPIWDKLFYIGMIHEDSISDLDLNIMKYYSNTS